jgi:transcriptional regulator with XRE-family HTH domain
MGIPRTTESATSAIDWARWMRELGGQVLRVREFLGLSQGQLSRLAGVSQGAVSRLENGRGMATPLLVVTKICGALRDALAHMDQALLSDEARRIVLSGMSLPDTRQPFPSPAQDPGVEELLRSYHRLSERQRHQLLAVLRATAAALVGESESTPAGGQGT